LKWIIRAVIFLFDFIGKSQNFLSIQYNKKLANFKLYF